MASRENQGLQIALILSAGLVVILGGLLYLVTSYWKEETQRANLAVKDAAASKATLTQTIDKMTEIKFLMGYGLKDENDTIQANYKKDVETYAASMRESERNYRNIVTQLWTELQKKNELLVDAENRVQQSQAEGDANKKVYAGELATYEAGLKQAKDDVAEELKKFGLDRSRFNKETVALTSKFERRQKDLDDQINKGSEELKEVSTVLGKAKEDLETLSDRLREKDLSAELADGKVTWVNQRDKLVWLNLGTDDGLRRQVPFAVIGSEETKLRLPKTEGEDEETRNGNIKANIEVIRIINAHLAEARIMDDNPSKPIMPGDQLFSAAWRPGHAEHFALVGLLDLDKNGISDLEKVKNLITVNGGVVDAFLNDNGTKTGKITVDTRYLVVGKEPTEKATADYVSNFTKLMNEAKALPVKMITLEDLILYFGYKEHEKTVPLGSDARESDFKARAPSDVPRHTPPGSYRDRRKVPVHPNDRAF